jgi:hypothetical protein
MTIKEFASMHAKKAHRHGGACTVACLPNDDVFAIQERGVLARSDEELAAVGVWLPCSHAPHVCQGVHALHHVCALRIHTAM